MEQELITEEDKEELEKVKKRPFHLNKRGEKNRLYRTTEFLNALEKYYLKYENFNYVSELLQKEFNCSIDHTTVKKIYRKNISEHLIRDKKDNLFKESYSKFLSQWEDVADMFEILGKAQKRYLKIISENSEGNEVKDIVNIIRMQRQIIEWGKAVKEQLEFISKKQEEIIKVNNVNNNLSINIVSEVQNFMPKMSENDLRNFFKSIIDKKFIEKLKKVVKELK